MPILIPAKGFDVGDVREYYGATLPADGCWRWADGAIYNVADFPVAGAFFGNRFGGDGVATFGVPDRRGRVAVGRDNMGGTAANRITAAVAGFNGATLGAVGGAQSHTLATSEMPSHNHPTARRIESGNISGLSGFSVYSKLEAMVEYSIALHGRIEDQGGGGAHRNVQPSIVSNFIVKVK